MHLGWTNWHYHDARAVTTAAAGAPEERRVARGPFRDMQWQMQSHRYPVVVAVAVAAAVGETEQDSDARIENDDDDSDDCCKSCMGGEFGGTRIVRAARVVAAGCRMIRSVPLNVRVVTGTATLEPKWRTRAATSRSSS